jgi:hypothetical protein
MGKLSRIANGRRQLKGTDRFHMETKENHEKSQGSQ